MERITIIGGGPIGVSIGQSLMRRNLSNTEVVITSGDRGVLSTVSKMDAAHRTVSGLGTAIDGAQLIILDTPIGELREMMESIGPSVDPGAVVTDTANIKGPVMRWAGEFLPKDATFIGGHPLLKAPPESLQEADPSVFAGAKYTVTPSEAADDQSIRTVVGLVEALGARPIFLDPSEHDSYAAAMHHLPVVMSSAFVTATAGSAGWREMHQLAESQFNSFGKHASNHPLDNEAMCMANPEALVHWVDQLILELYNYRNEISEDGDALLERFGKAWELRAKWEADAVVPRDGPNLPSARDSMMGAMLGSKLADRLSSSKKDDDDKGRSWGLRRRGR